MRFLYALGVAVVALAFSHLAVADGLGPQEVSFCYSEEEANQVLFTHKRAGQQAASQVFAISGCTTARSVFDLDPNQDPQVYNDLMENGRKVTKYVFRAKSKFFVHEVDVGEAEKVVSTSTGPRTIYLVTDKDFRKS